MIKSDQQRITQHKRFVPYGTHPSPALIFGGAWWAGSLNNHWTWAYVVIITWEN